MNDPTNWNADPDTGSLEFANPGEAKRAEDLFRTVQNKARTAGMERAIKIIKDSLKEFGYQDRAMSEGLDLAGEIEHRIREQDLVGSVDRAMNALGLKRDPDERDTLRKIRTAFAAMPQEAVYTRDQILRCLDVVSEQLT